MVIEPDPRPEPIIRPKRASKKPSGLTSLFRRKFNFDGLSESSAPNSPDVTQIPEPTRAAPTLQPTTMYVIFPLASDASAYMNSECVSCLDDFAATQMVTLSCHSYCTECFQRLIR